MKHQIWKRLTAMTLAVVMTVMLLPTAAYAALWDNTPGQNQEILRELTEFWGDEKTAEEAVKLLRQYGLIDKEGNVLTNWSGTITIQEESRPLTIGEAWELAGGDVTVNGRACTVERLKEALDNLASLGLLADNTPVAGWQLQVDGQAVAPAELSAVLDGWTAQEAPETPEENPENPGEAPKAESGLLQSIAALFTLGSEVPAAPVVTVLGRYGGQRRGAEGCGFSDPVRPADGDGLRFRLGADPPRRRAEGRPDRVAPDVGERGV